MQTALVFAVWKYAMGASFQSPICKVMQLEPGTALKEADRTRDLTRLKRAEKAASEPARKRRNACNTVN